MLGERRVFQVCGARVRGRLYPLWFSPLAVKVFACLCCAGQARVGRGCWSSQLRLWPRRWIETFSWLTKRNQTQIRTHYSHISMKSRGFQSIICSETALLPCLFCQPMCFWKLYLSVPARILRFVSSLVTMAVSCLEPAGRWGGCLGRRWFASGSSVCGGVALRRLASLLALSYFAFQLCELWLVYKPQGKIRAGSGFECL